jgi:basic amino acid/polyamine antiporter, APA family
MNQKIGFWSVFALVIGSQIGSGVFMLPSTLAPFGVYSLLGWIISGFGAIMLSLVFAKLCQWFPKTGGPHNYVEQAFGREVAFFAGWTYWVISWVSTPVVLITCVGYLSPFLKDYTEYGYLIAELLILYSLTLINFKGIKTAGNTEFILTLLKIIPLVALPLVALSLFKADNFAISQHDNSTDSFNTLSHVALLTLWGFIGLESATTPAGSVVNPSKTIPLAVVSGTLCVAILYFFNSLSILGAIPAAELIDSKAPYVSITKILFAGDWYMAISIIAAVICMGTANAWIITSGQIGLGLAQDKLFPKIFSKTNKHGAPIYSLAISSIGVSVLLILTMSNNIREQIIAIIDVSVTAFVFVYTICILSYLKILFSRKNESNLLQWFYGISSLLFCIWIIALTTPLTLLYSGLFTLSGIFIYIYNKRNDRKNNIPT